MSVIVTDQGFVADDGAHEFTAIEDLAANDTVRSLDLPSDTDVSLLAGRLLEFKMIRVDFPSFADGRGFTIARRLLAADGL